MPDLAARFIGVGRVGAEQVAGYAGGSTLEVFECAAEVPASQRTIWGSHLGPILALHNQEECAEVAAASGVYIAAHLDKLQQLVTAENSEVRIVVGQVLWKGGQLEHELLEGMWLPLPATPKLVFASADEMWQQSMREVGNHYLSMITGATPPVNVQWN